MKGLLLFLLGVIVGIIVLAAVEVFLLPPPPLPQTGAGPPDMVILFRNEFLTRELQRQSANIRTTVPLQRLVVRTIAGNELIVAGTLSVPNTGVAVPARITLHPVVRDNQVAVQVIKVDVGTLTIPGQYLTAVEGPINEELNRWIASSQFEILAVSTTPEGLIVDVSIKGP